MITWGFEMIWDKWKLLELTTKPCMYSQYEIHWFLVTCLRWLEQCPMVSTQKFCCLFPCTTHDSWSGLWAPERTCSFFNSTVWTMGLKCGWSCCHPFWATEPEGKKRGRQAAAGSGCMLLSWGGWSFSFSRVCNKLSVSYFLWLHLRLSILNSRNKQAQF